MRDMEAEMLIHGIAYLQSKHIPKLMKSINNNSLKLMLGLPQIDLSAILHIPKRI